MLYILKKHRTILKCALLLVVFSFSFVVPVEAQKRKKANKEYTPKQAEKKEAQREKDIERAEEKGKRKHLKLQEKEVRKRMKMSRKKARRYDEGRREPFLKRLFTKKRRKR